MNAKNKRLGPFIFLVGMAVVALLEDLIPDNLLLDVLKTQIEHRQKHAVKLRLDFVYMLY